MPLLSSLDQRAVVNALRGPGLRLVTPPFTVDIRSTYPIVAEGLMQLYGDYPLAGPDQFTDVQIAVRPHRRLFRPTCVFTSDGFQPFMPLSRPEAFALFEWGLNWCISSQQHSYLIVHAAVLARPNGQAVILPAPPGSGKSTLCAALSLRGWRLLSDELTLIDLDSGSIQPFPRPISLKNASIDVIRDFAPDAHFGPEARNTVKGTIRHLRPGADAIAAGWQHAQPRWVVFPQYRAGAEARLTRLGRAEGFMALAENAFNYLLLRERGFDAFARLVGNADMMRFE